MEIFHRHLKNTSVASNWKSRLSLAVYYILFLGLWFFAIIPFTKRPYIREFYTVCWIIEIITITFYAFVKYSATMFDEYSVGGLIASMLFLAQILAHSTILWNVYCKQQKRKLFYLKIENLDYRLIESELEVPINVDESNWNRTLLIISIFLQLAFWHSVISWTTFQVHATGTELYWPGLLSSLALQFCMIEFLMGIVLLNSRLINLRCNINLIGERNLRLFFPNAVKPQQRTAKNCRFLLVSPYHNEAEEERQLKAMKSIYNEIFSIFQLANDCYGWSLLAFAALYFVDFVTNSYFVVFGIITQSSQQLTFLQNAGFLWNVIVMLSTICWHCQKSHDYSRQIGCLIFKLVKPLGNKRYNDLVNEFSLQTMHQQFIITAKEFFSVNLNLLGSMVAAIVTYLVILIQFMFTEKSNLERARTTMNPLNITMTKSRVLVES